MDDRTLDLIKTLRASPHQDKIEEVLPKETLEYLSRNPNADSIHLELPLSSLLPTVDFYEKTEEFVKALESVMHFIGHEQSFLRMFVASRWQKPESEGFGRFQVISQNRVPSDGTAPSKQNYVPPPSAWVTG